MRVVIAALLVTTTIWAQSAQQPNPAPQQGPPPKNLTVRPDGHVSANLDPENPEQFEVHVVLKGETLSGIAGEVLKNPRLWPQLWEQNEHIINPHWIYPNDKILIQPITPITEAKPPEPEPVPEPVAVAEPPARPVQLPPPAPPQPQTPPQTLFIVDEQKPVSQIKFDDLYCSGSVRTAPLPEDLKVIAKLDADGTILATEREYVYLSQGSDGGVAVGSTYQVIRPTRSISNPYGRTGNERDLGKHYLDVGQLRVIMTQPDFAVARVVHSCADAVDPGDLLMPFQAMTIPDLPRPRPFNPLLTPTGSGVLGSIVTSKDVMLSYGSTFKVSGKLPGVRGTHLGPLERGISGEGAIVYIDAGQEKSVKPGDVFTVFRNVLVYNKLYKLPKDSKKLEDVRTAIGELVVVKVGERAATAVVTYAADALVMGDTVQRR